MNSAVIAGLVKAQAPAHLDCRAQEFIEFDGMDSKIIVQCACNVRLTLTVPKVEPPKASKAPKVAPDGS